MQVYSDWDWTYLFTRVEGPWTELLVPVCLPRPWSSTPFCPGPLQGKGDCAASPPIFLTHPHAPRIPGLSRLLLAPDVRTCRAHCHPLGHTWLCWGPSASLAAGKGEVALGGVPREISWDPREQWSPELGSQGVMVPAGSLMVPAGQRSGTGSPRPPG